MVNFSEVPDSIVRLIVNSVSMGKSLLVLLESVVYSISNVVWYIVISSHPMQMKCTSKG